MADFMALAHTVVTFDCDIKKVWDKMTSHDDFSWRRDIIEIRVESETSFTEINNEEYPTHFTVTEFVPYEKLSFEIENGSLYGHWTGVFSENDGKAVVDFTEEVAAKKLMARPLIKLFLNRQLENYIADLRKAVNQ